MLTYPNFFRERGIRFISQLDTPKTTLLSELILPLNSVLHWVENNPNNLGISEDEEILNQQKGFAIVKHITELNPEVQLGKPTKISIPVDNLIREYHQKNKDFKRYINNNIGLLKNPRNFMIISYNLISRHYRYLNNIQTEYWKWANLFNTFLKTLEVETSLSDRQHFIQCDVPTLLPTINTLNTWTDKTNTRTLSLINSDTLRIVADIWTWLGPNREDSFLSKIDKASLNKLNVIFTYGSVYVCLNLGILDSWRIGDDKEGKAPGFTKMQPLNIQRRFLHLLMVLHETKTVASGLDVKEVEVVESDALSLKASDDDEVNDSKPKRIEDIENSEARAEVNPHLKGGVIKTTSVIELLNKGVDVKDTKDDDALEDIPEYSDEDIEKNLKQLEVINREESDLVDKMGYKPYTPVQKDLEQYIIDDATELAKKGLLSAGEHRRFSKLAGKFKSTPSPYNEKENLKQLAEIKPESLVVHPMNVLKADIPGVLDKSMLSSSLNQMDNTYNRTILPKDIAGMVLSLQKAGFIVQNYEVQRVDDYTDSYNLHRVKVIPLSGKPTTLRFQIPIINENGTFKANGVKYRMRKQRGDVPIRKTGPDRVALTSYYNKLFVMRSDRAVFNYKDWLTNNIVNIGIDANDARITDLRLGNCLRVELPHDLPKTYTTISTRISGFKTAKYEFFFDYSKIKTHFGEQVYETLIPQEGQKRTLQHLPVGKTKTNELIVMDKSNNLFVSVKDKGLVPIGTMESILELPLEKKPIEIAEVDILGQTIPLGVLLAYQIGLGNLINTLDAKPRRVPTGSNYNLQPHEFIIRFQDFVLIFDKNDRYHAMLFGGFNRYHREIKHYSIFAFDKKDIYGNVLEPNGFTARHFREFDLMFKMWVDPITEGLLKDMGYPTDLFLLFLEATKMLLNDNHPHENNRNYTRDKGYERIPGMLYFELMRAMRTYKAKPLNPNASLDLNPQALWMSVVQDQTVMPIEESNPIHALKEQEVIIYSGSGGRTGRTMTGKSRVFHDTEKGLTSEATVDSGDVGTIVYTSADPNYNSLRGTSRRIADKELTNNAAKVVSTSMLLAPVTDRDDPKRVLMTSVQNSQTTHCEHYTPMPLRTGYDRVIAHRSDALFAKTARTDGVVDNVTDKVITIKYKDGETVSYELGIKHGVWAGHYIPHEIVTELKKGSKVKPGDVLLYNKKYFTRDTLDKNQVILKTGVLAHVAFMERTDTLEDSSTISQILADKLVTQTTYIRNIKVTFGTEIRNLLKEGEQVDAESILCTLHSTSEGNNDIFSDESLSTLSMVSSSTPRAKNKGVINKIEVLYTGEMEDMSTSLRHIAELSDSKLRRFNKEMGRKAVDGRVDVGFRIDGHPLEQDAAVIKVYIVGPTAMGVGDKVVYFNQMKSVVGSVTTGINETESGVPIDVFFAYQSLSNRIVLSAEVIATTNTLLLLTGQRAVAAYRGK